MNKNIIIKESSVHGKGIFANRDFKKGEVVLKWKAKQILTAEEMEKLSQEEKRYCSFVEEGKWIFFDEPCKYVNHSCEPNTEAKNQADVAVKDIKKGEEITANYVAEKVPGIEFECRCDHKKCKKTIIS